MEILSLGVMQDDNLVVIELLKRLMVDVSHFVKADWSSFYTDTIKLLSFAIMPHYTGL